jgi:hypothetical protein
MTDHDGDMDGLIAALREDLPGPDDERRVRARLTAAGVALGASLVAPAGAAAAGASGAALSSAGGSVAIPGGAAVPTSAWASALAKVAGLTTGTKSWIVAGVIATGAAYPVASSLVTDGERPAIVAPTESIGAGDAGARRGVAASRQAAQRSAEASEPARMEAEAAPLAQASRASVKPRSAVLPAAAVLPATAVPPAAVGRGDEQGSPAKIDRSTLEAETVLIEQALVAARSGDDALARSVLAEHERRFPNGALALERRRALEGLR